MRSPCPEISVYLHVPFCARKCRYCDFPSWAGREDLMEPTVRRMEEEIAGYAGRDLRAAHVFFGGGTPSVMPPALLRRLMAALRRAFDIAPGAEISMEINPGTLTEALLDALPEMGVNRVSLGLQSAQDRLLLLLGRIHRFEDAAEAVGRLRERGIANLNLDLMIGLPTQTVGDAEESVRAALGLGVPHLSCYSLIPEEGTELWERLRTGEWTLPEEDDERAMYYLCRRLAAEKGLEQYEISNFARPGFECRYNVHVWRRGEYVGIGCAAAGHLDRVRQTNPATLEGYLRGDPPERREITPEEARFEAVMLGLRLTEGIREADFIRDFGMTFAEAFGTEYLRSAEEGLLLTGGGRLRLTEKGMDLQNRVLLRFMK